MGSDYRMLGDSIAIHSHGSLMQALQAVKKALEKDDPVKWAGLLKQVNQAIANGSF